MDPPPYVAKILVLICAAVAGVYTTAWARRWIADAAGWAGVCVVLLPGFVRFSNAVLLNVPATALGLGALYHFRRWLETSRPRDLRLFTALIVASLLTYYPSAVILPITFVWMLWFQKGARAGTLWSLAGGLLVLVILTATVVPVYVATTCPVLGVVARAATLAAVLPIVDGDDRNRMVRAGIGRAAGRRPVS